MNNRELEIYLGGVFDGEGCIRIEGERGNYVGTPRLTVGMYCEEIINLYVYKFGGIQYESWPKGASRHGSHLRFNWAINGKEALKSLAILYPFLIEKKEQAKILLSWPYSNQKPIPIHTRKLRLEIMQGISELKSRNRPEDFITR